MAKFNYMVTASFIADKCRKVNTADARFYHFTVGKYDLMHDSDEGALYVKTPKIGLLVSFVSLDSVKRHINSGNLSEKLISDYVATRGGNALQSWPERAEQARRWLSQNINI